MRPQVFPLLRESIAYYLLRPLQPDAPPDTLCGAFEGRSQEITREWHAHLVDGMVSIPKVGPGDMVFWHCDTIHAVDATHQGATDSAVFYIPAGAASRMNDRWVRPSAPGHALPSHHVDTEWCHVRIPPSPVGVSVARALRAPCYEAVLS